ncbi:hypothetical protein FN846DRAFT_1001593 [Sphaerosporella brunnea]|uniref:Uncharacterized protein n=1 Tax=Sphaerosporella brunnea TaxID=1250544 RepID=A0A5J5EEM8_9PEZI|nr:hypothetical protein FN846DRAFT_1001593 [Sphaerosporella brunnea]
MSTRKRLVVLSGGSAANNLIEVFTTLCSSGERGLDFILPISDNGGSTSEILRVFGGPGIGDVRSRLIRLVPDDTADLAVKHLLNHRLSSRTEWLELVEGTHPLWAGISSEKRELIRSFFNLLNLELIKRQRPGSAFNFLSASTGNLFLTGARVFFGSFESAIYLFRSITGVPDNIQVLPAINSMHTHHIAAGLESGEVITGQNQISHPSPPSPPPTEVGVLEEEEVVEDQEEDANLPGSLRELRMQNIEFSKTEEQALPARIERVWYINPYGHEIRPPANPKVVASLAAAEAVVYSIGSLYTSLAPILILRNIHLPASVPKILLLNGSHDRETAGMTATDYVRAIARCLGGRNERELKSYVTHVIYLEGNGAPPVDVKELRQLGVEAVRVYGRRNPAGDGKGMLYDPVPLPQALAAILGKNRGKRADTRRNTTRWLSR